MEVMAEGLAVARVMLVTDVAADRSALPGVAPRLVGLTEWGSALSHLCLSVPLSVTLPSTLSPPLPHKYVFLLSPFLFVPFFHISFVPFFFLTSLCCRLFLVSVGLALGLREKR